MTLEERFREKVGRRDRNGCRPWKGAIDAEGYGRIRLGGRGSAIEYAHRVAYRLDVGPIPEGKQIDHVYERGCRLRSCVEPSHLEAVVQRENVRRGLAAMVIRTGRCVRGHLRTVHGYQRPDGYWSCRACRRYLRAERAAA